MEKHTCRDCYGPLFHEIEQAKLGSAYNLQRSMKPLRQLVM